MLLTEEVIIDLKPRQIKYYEELGYEIPKYNTSRRKIMRVKVGTKISVKVKDLPKNSHQLVSVLCDCCNENIIEKEYRCYLSEREKSDRDTCVVCGCKKSGRLHAHHLASFANNHELRLDIENGMTVCDIHHDPSIKDSFHNIYGTYNTTKEQFFEYIQYIRNKNDNPPLDNKEVI
jgi:hypothetical protein